MMKLMMNGWLWVTLICFLPASPPLASEMSPHLTEDVVVNRVLSLSRLGKISQLHAAITETQAMQARSPYDFTLNINGSHEIDSSEKVISVFGNRNDTTILAASLSRIFPSGTQAEIGYTTNRQKSDSNFVTTNPAFDSSWFVGLRQPLLRDSFGSAMRAQIEAAEANAKAAESRANSELQTIVNQALSAFWSWITFDEDKSIAKLGVKRARDFLSVTQKKFKLGTAEKADLFAAQASLAAREQDVLQSEERAENALTTLKNVLLLSPSQHIESGETLKQTTPPGDLEQLLQTALTKHPDVQAAEKDLWVAQRTYESSKSGARPQLDIFTKLTMNNVDDTWGGSATGAFGSDDPDWVVGSELIIPFENRQRKAERKMAKLRQEIMALQFNQVKDNVATNVRIAWNSLTAAQAQTKKALKLEHLQRKKLAEEEKDFRRGRSDAFTILTYQQDLIAAERQRLAAQAKEQIAQNTLAYAVGHLLPE